MSDPPERETKKIDRTAFEDFLDAGEDPPTAVTHLGDLRSLLRGDCWAITFLSGTNAGMVVPLEDGETVFGRSADADIQTRDDSLSRRHAAFVLTDDALIVRDLGSTNGTYVDGKRVAHPMPVPSGGRVQLGLSTLLCAQKLSPTELESAQRLWESSIQDPLTGVSNRRYLDHRLDTEYAFASRHRRPLSVLVLDIDHFKNVNDTHGHPAGDAVLRALGLYLLTALRGEDVVARFGGEEFVMVLRDEDAGGAQIVAERIRAHIEAMDVDIGEQTIRITASIGVATHSAARPYGNPSALIAAADACLYRAKRAGRNLVIADSSPRSVPPLY